MFNLSTKSLVKTLGHKCIHNLINFGEKHTWLVSPKSTMMIISGVFIVVLLGMLCVLLSPMFPEIFRTINFYMSNIYTNGGF